MEPGMPRTLRLRLFGGIRAEVEVGDRAEPAALEPKRLALLAYLAADVAGRLHTRDSLLAIFWPERPESLARLALRQSLHHISTRVSPEILLREGHQLVGLVTERVSCDVHRFEKALAERRFRDALDEYQGDFLDGFILSTQPEPFEEWIRRTRTRFRDAAIAALEAVAEQEGIPSAGPHPTLGWVHRALVLSPYSEDLLDRAVDLRLRSGDRGGALGEVRDFSRRLHEDMGMEPSRRVEGLRDRATSRDEDERAISAQGLPVRLPDDGLRPEIEIVLAGRADRVTREAECTVAGGRTVPCPLVVEPIIRNGIICGATIRLVR